MADDVKRLLELAEKNSRKTDDVSRLLELNQRRREREDLPEFDLPPSFALTHPLKTARTAFGMMTTFDPGREVNVLRQNFPELQFEEDPEGNVIVDASAYGGGRGYLNKPGVSTRDVLDFAGQAAMFTPAGKAGGAARTLLGGATKVGAASGATQAAMDVANQAVGGTENVSALNVDPLNLGLATVGGAAGEAVGRLVAPLISRYVPIYQRTGITPEMRQEFAKAAQEAGIDPSEVGDDFIRRAMDSARKARQLGDVDPGAQAQMDEFGITYTKGQGLPPGRARVRQLNREDTLREGAASPGAQDVMRRIQEGQAQDIGSAAERIRRGFGGGDISRPNQAAAAARDAVSGKAAALDESIGRAYEEVGDAFVNAEGLETLADAITTAPRRLGQTVDDLTPATKATLSEARKLSQFLNKHPGKIKPMHINRIERMRQRLGDRIGAAANNTDRRYMTQLKREFDVALDSAIEDALFSGDEAALEALKKARGLHREYMQKFTQQNQRLPKSGRTIRDTAGDAIERMAAADPTPEEISNWLFGSAKLGAKKGSAALASRLKGILGPDSDEWNQIRQAAFLKLTEPTRDGTISGRRFLNRLNEAVQGSGESFIRELFTPEEVGQLRRFAKAIIRAQPEIQNPSRTSYKIAQMMGQEGGKTLRMIGWSQGPAVGAITDIGTRGGGALREFMSKRQAIEAAAGAARPLRSVIAPAVSAPAASSVADR